jgi:hypothetical protein
VPSDRRTYTHNEGKANSSYLLTQRRGDAEGNSQN